MTDLFKIKEDSIELKEITYMSTETCYCGRDKFGDFDKCILHCEKDDWFKVMPNGQKFWKSMNDVNHFWEEYIKIDLGNSDKEYNLHFPIFPSRCIDKRSFSTRVRNLFKDIHIIDFTDCIFYGEVEITQKLLKLKITNSIILSDFKIKLEPRIESIIKSSIKIKDVEFRGKFKIKNESEQGLNVTLTKAYFFNEFSFDGNVTTFRTTVCEFKESYLRLHNSYKTNTILTFYATDFNDKIFLRTNEKNIDRLRFKYCNFNSIINISSKNYDEEKCLHYEGAQISKMTFFSCMLNKESLLIVNVYIINMLSFNEVNHNGKVIIKDIGENNELIFDDYNVESTVLMNCNFSDSKIIIENTNLLSDNVFFSVHTTKWPLIDNFTCNTDTFRQLKLVNDKQGNYIEANKFYSAEMDGYKKEITSKNSNVPFQEKFIFWMNYLVSDFGRSWVQPLLWYVTLGLFFSSLYHGDHIYTFMISCYFIVLHIGLGWMIHVGVKVIRVLKLAFLNLLIFDYIRTIKDYKGFWSRLCRSITFMNPFDTNKDEPEDGIIGWWILFRLFALFIIYQFIISLRRQTKR